MEVDGDDPWRGPPSRVAETTLKLEARCLNRPGIAEDSNP